MIWCWLWSFLALFWLFSLKVAIICHDPNSVFIVNTIKFARVSMLKVVIKNRSLPHKWRPKMMFINQNLVAPNYRPWLGNSIRSSNWLPIEIKRGMSYYTPNAPNRFLHKNPFTHSIHIISHVHPMYIPCISHSIYPAQRRNLGLAPMAQVAQAPAATAAVRCAPCAPSAPATPAAPVAPGAPAVRADLARPTLEIHRFWFFDRRLFRIQCWVMNVMNSANSIRNAQKDQESSTVATPRPERELKGPIISLADCSATTQRSGCRPWASHSQNSNTFQDHFGGVLIHKAQVFGQDTPQGFLQKIPISLLATK